VPFGERERSGGGTGGGGLVGSPASTMAFRLGMCPLLPARWLRVSVRLGRWLRLQLSFLVINSTR
jgi:hypothetical protein